MPVCFHLDAQRLCACVSVRLEVGSFKAITPFEERGFKHKMFLTKSLAKAHNRHYNLTRKTEAGNWTLNHGESANSYTPVPRLQPFTTIKHG